MIEKLTPIQEKAMSKYRDKWLKIGLDTSPCKRDGANLRINECYEIAGLKKPETIFWFDSPISAVIGKLYITKILEAVKSKAKIGDSVRDSVGDSVRDSVRDSVWDSVRDSVGASVRASVGDSVGASVWASVRDSVGASVRDSVWDFIYGSHDAPWLSFYNYFLEIFNLKCCEKLIPLMELAKNSGWWLPYSNIAICSEKPEIIKLKDGRIHCDGGPAIRYRDGFSVWGLHGVRISKEIAETPAMDLDPKLLIKEQNAEVRREVIRKVGMDRILQKLKGKKLDSWREYELYQIDNIDIEPVGLLKMTCPSTQTFYTLRIPPEIKEARKAINWVNWNIDPEKIKKAS